MDNKARKEAVRAKVLERLEKLQERSHESLGKKQQRTNEQFERRRQRIDNRVERLRSHLLQQAGDPSDQQQRIIQAALKLLDEEGINGLSLRKLAAKVQVQAPALYWHFKNKEMLIDYMAEAILQEEFKDLTSRKSDESWQNWLVHTCEQLRTAMRTHKDGARVVAGAHLYPAVTLMKIFEAAMESLTSAGIELQKANLIITTTVHFVFGNVIEEQSSPSVEDLKNFVYNKPVSDYPLMAKSVKQSYQDALKGYDEFEDSLKLIIGHATT